MNLEKQRYLQRRTNRFPAWAVVVLCFLFVVFGCRKAVAQADDGSEEATAGGRASPEIANENPTEVRIGLYLLRIPSFDLRQNHVGVDFYLWFLWKGEEVTPVETFEIMNGTVQMKELIEQEVVDGWNYACLRVQSTITEYWDMSRYPLDRHTLNIEIEDTQYDVTDLVYTTKTETSGVDAGFQVTGWDLSDPVTEITTYSYKTNYGRPDMPADQASHYSRFVFSVHLERPSILFALKKFYGLFLAVFIGMCALMISPSHASPRFSVGVGAVFTIVGNHFVVASGLPDTSQLTLVDQLHIFAGVTILASIFASVVSVLLWDWDKKDASNRFDRVCVVLFPVVFLVFCLQSIV